MAWRVGLGLAALLAFLLVPATVYLAGSRAYEASLFPPPKTAATVAAAFAATPPAHDPRKPTVAVVVGNSGANIADTLVAYDVLATSGAFNVYVVAPESRPVPLTGGLHLVPDLTFTQLRQRLGGSVPDVTVVPARPYSDATGDSRVTAWLRDTASGELVLGVCAGARLLAEAGVLDGRNATSHWYRLPGLEKDYPAVNWRRGVRYVDDGDVITTGGLLSVADGALRVVERLVGVDAAKATAAAVGWRHYSPGAAAPLPRSRLTVNDALISVVNVGFRWEAPTIGVALTDGVSEIEVAAAFDPWVEQPQAARTLAIAAGGGAVRSRHGLTFISRAGLDAAGRVDRLVVPGAGAAANPVADVAAAARRGGVPVVYLHEQSGFAFDAALRDLARTLDVPTARWAAKVLEYPAVGLGLSGPGWPWQVALRPLLLGLAGLAVVLGVARLARLARSRRS